MPVRSKLLVLVTTTLYFFIASGCLPTSESGGISSLSKNFSISEISPTLHLPTATLLPDPTVLPALPSQISMGQLPAPLPETPQTLTPTPVSCLQGNGEIINREIPSTFLKQPLKVRIYLPPCFSTTPAQPYPLLILLHGSIFTDDQWDRLGIDETSDRLIAGDSIKPLMIVMPYEEQTLANPYQPGFGPALTDEMIPWLEKEYPVCSERACRAIGGISRGAAWAVHLGFTQWQLFESIGGHSLPPFWGDLNNLPIWLSSIPKNERPRVFLDVGINDSYRQPAAQFEQFLTDNNIAHEWYVYNGSHDETYWASHIEQYLLWYSSAWEK